MNYRHRQSLSIIFLFGSYLLIFFLLSVFIPKRTFSETENRYLAKHPAANWKTVKDGSFGRSYELYLSDQFPFRDSFISTKTLAEEAQFKKEINGVFLGKDGYLMEALYPEDIDPVLYEKNLERLRQFAVTQAEILGKDHVRIMLVPSAAQILTDKLPGMAAPFDQEQVISRLETGLSPASGHDARAGLAGATDLASATGLSPLIVPVSAALENASENVSENVSENTPDAALENAPETASENTLENAPPQLYYRTDHHWTTYGAFTAYEAWMESINMTPLSLEDFDIQIVSSTFYGTIHSKLNRSATADSIELFILKDQPDFQVIYDGSGKVFHTLYSMEALKTKDQYRVFLDGNHGWTKIENPDSKSGRRLLMIKDSYAHCFAPFAALHFDQVHMVDLRYYNGRISDFMENEKITDLLVLYQIPGFLQDANLVKLNR